MSQQPPEPAAAEATTEPTTEAGAATTTEPGAGAAEDIGALTSGGAVRPITRWGEPVMHAGTRPVVDYDDELRALIRDMFATMAAAEGVGLAATQVGVGLSVFVFDCPDDDHRRHVGVLCNPVVTLPEGKERRLDSGDEGCLSLPGAFIECPRPDFAVCTGQDAWGRDIRVEGTGYFARCLQHETDHLNGTVFGDRLSGRARKKLYAQHERSAEDFPADWPVSPRTDDESDRRTSRPD